MRLSALHPIWPLGLSIGHAQLSSTTQALGVSVKLRQEPEQRATENKVRVVCIHGKSERLETVNRL